MDRPKPTEQEISIVTNWIKDIGILGKVVELDTMLLRSVLSEYGANFEFREELNSLTKYSNLGKRPGLDAVWGKENIDAYKKWIKEYISTYEKETGTELPVLEETNIKTSGMMQFLGELTAYAA